MVGAWRTSTPKRRRHMECYQGGRSARLFGKRRRVILGESGISPEITPSANTRPSIARRSW